MKRKFIFSCILFLGFLGINKTFAQVEPKENEPIKVFKTTNDISEPSGAVMINSPVINQNITVQEVDLLWDVQHPFHQNQQQATQKENYTNKRILKPGDAIIFEVDNNTIKEDSSFFPLLPAEIEEAIARTPIWIHYDLRFKFRLIENTAHRTKMIDLLNATPKQYLDEVAFMLTYLPYEVLKDGRFINDWDYLIENVEMIYTFADSLKYVEIVEKGDTNTNDWKTTTKYKIKQGSNFIWREIDPYIYYQFIVMPKIEQEGVYVADGNSPAYQRTWGYSWREYLWFDPDTNRSYRPVNISGYKVVDASGKYDSLKVDTIPRLGEIMQMPEYLWNEAKTIYFFNREFKPTDDAMNVLGNWCSQCIPMDVTSTDDYRPSQPNHIAWKHIGNCHEDALLVAAAARTCLIPLMHIGDFCDDHVWGMFNDGSTKWHHFEFFRGGCSPGRPYYWGMTNLVDDGGYGWTSSLVQGYVPDGTLYNVSEYYSNQKPSSMLDLTFVDSLGAPIDGVRVNLYSTNVQYGKEYIMSAGYLWTDATGRIHTPIGTDKKYYMKFYHPKYGSYPLESGIVYILINSKTISGKTYPITFVMPATPKNRSRVATNKNTYDFEKSLKISFAAKNITTDMNPVDGQRSVFYERTRTDAFLNAHVLTESEMNKFKTYKTAAISSIYTFYQKQPGELAIPLQKSGKTYIALTNDFNYKNFVEIEYRTDIVAGGEFDVSINNYNTEEISVYMYPNPANNYLNINTFNTNINRIQIFDITGKEINTINVSNETFSIIDINHLTSGIYFISITTEKGKTVKKFIKQ
ncbi:MAG: T9SS type A sorting domain-containing protein [Bacteroidales bacterium]|jgi:hypothetical protein|nr:T9SS type A sorting domain-containing protein [Bacteroidales bacterium]